MREVAELLNEIKTKLNWAHWEKQWARQWQEEVPVATVTGGTTFVHHQVSALPEEPEDLVASSPREGRAQREAAKESTGGGAGGGGGAIATAAAAVPGGPAGGGGGGTAEASVQAKAPEAAGAQARIEKKDSSSMAKATPDDGDKPETGGTDEASNKGCQCIIS
jgi:hypothetical protein